MFPWGRLKEPLWGIRKKVGEGECQAALTSVYDDRWK